ncbi:MAG: helix-turn-helix domain-containing protein [Candidatus Thermoplasmatota archaeon]|nr:helix-turn-helix domain-containing protein [Candidatus Thermoplasmatota archaeon]
MGRGLSGTHSTAVILRLGFYGGLDYPTIGWHVMVGFDDALNILENPTRRDILRHLVKEPHYPLQLSELLEVSQQAVVKHLRVLEEAGFVDSESKKSDKGGPPRKVYTVNQSFSIRLDLGPDLFRAEHRKMPKGSSDNIASSLPEGLGSLLGRIGSKKSLQMADAMDILSDLDAALERVDKQRDAIISLHQQVMNKVSPSVEENFDSYEERQLAHAMMRNPRRPLDLDAFSNGLRIQSVHAEKMMETLRKQLMRDLSSTSGSFIAGEDAHGNLPWWMVK